MYVFAVREFSGLVKENGAQVVVLCTTMWFTILPYFEASERKGESKDV